MRIFYIDWQQHWKYDRTMNIGANAHGKRAVSTLKTVTSDRLDLRWQLGFQWHRIGMELVLQVPRLFHNATVSQCEHFLLLHMYMYLLFETSPGWRGFFLNSIWWGPLSSNVFTICAVYWSLGRRGYFGVSNVVLVFITLYRYTWYDYDSHQSVMMDYDYQIYISIPKLCATHIPS